MEDEVSESASTTVKGIDEATYLYVVQNYSRHSGIGPGESIESEEFIVGGYQWTIRLFPAGTTLDANKNGIAALLLNLNTQTNDYVSCLFAVHFLDQSGKDNHKGHTLLDDPKLNYCFAKIDRMVGFHNFILRKRIESPDYLKGDCLKIRLTLRVISSRDLPLPVIKVPEPNIGEEFGKLLQSKQGADVFFKVKNETFCAHKWILAARCPLFVSHLSASHQAKEIDIPDMEPMIFKALLWFVYTGILPEQELDDIAHGPSILTSFMGRMLASADRFELKTLKKICESRISLRISEQSVAYLLHLAEVCHAKELKAACLAFAAGNEAGLLGVLDSDGCRYLKEKCPFLFLELAYEHTNGPREQKSHNIFSAMRNSFACMVVPQLQKHKIKEV